MRKEGEEKLVAAGKVVPCNRLVRGKGEGGTGKIEGWLSRNRLSLLGCLIGNTKPAKS